jgi:hypothetical protein
MTEDEVEQYERDVMNAKTDKELNDVLRRWNPILAKCFRSTSLRVKELNKKMDSLTESVLEATTSIQTRINELHKKPSFKDSKIEWAMANIERILLTIVVFVLLFGRDFVKRFLED